jgi:hypothetical protein
MVKCLIRINSTIHSMAMLSIGSSEVKEEQDNPMATRGCVNDNADHNSMTNEGHQEEVSNHYGFIQ